jgi:hypothetical protein
MIVASRTTKGLGFERTSYPFVVIAATNSTNLNHEVFQIFNRKIHILIEMCLIGGVIELMDVPVAEQRA